MICLQKTKQQLSLNPANRNCLSHVNSDAPHELVYKAHIDPKLYVQWLGPNGYEMILKAFEPVSGGRYRYIHKDKDGNEYGFNGTFMKFPWSE